MLVWIVFAEWKIFILVWAHIIFLKGSSQVQPMAQLSDPVNSEAQIIIQLIVPKIWHSQITRLSFPNQDFFNWPTLKITESGFGRKTKLLSKQSRRSFAKHGWIENAFSQVINRNLFLSLVAFSTSWVHADPRMVQQV